MKITLNGWSHLRTDLRTKIETYRHTSGDTARTEVVNGKLIGLIIRTSNGDFCRFVPDICTLLAAGGDEMRQ